MSARGRRIVAFWLSVIGHALIVVALTFSIPLSPKLVTPGEIVIPIDTVMIDQSALDAQMAALEAARQEEIRQEQARVRQERQRQVEEQRQRDQALRIAEQQRQAEQDRLERIEREQREAAERAAEERRQREEEELRQREAEIARQREAEERQRREAIAREEVLRAVVAEQEENAARASGALDEWIFAISNDIKQKWIEPPNIPENFECIVRVTLIISGDVRDAQVISCTPNEENIIRSVKNAVLNASPLPLPSNRAVFQPVLQIRFVP